MEQKAGAQISRKAFLQSFLILLVLMLAAGVLTLVVPAGAYTRATLSDGREMIDPDSYTSIPKPDYPIWRSLAAPLEVLVTSDGLTIITIILFLLIVVVAFALLDRSGVLKAAIARIVARFGARKYVLLLVISFFFMLLGAFLGMFEEVVLLIPVMLALSYLLGWDTLVGLGMSILATNMGFSAAITNPFTIGLAQKIAGLPMFSGAWLRIVIFLVLFASLGIGFFISLSAGTESQAVQFAMIALLLSVFFSGFILDLRYLAGPVRVVSWLLPSTYGTILLQNIMLRGSALNLTLIGGLAAIGGVMFLLSWIMMRRKMGHD